jgi:Flp pilus assembly protein TadB
MRIDMNEKWIMTGLGWLPLAAAVFAFLLVVSLQRAARPGKLVLGRFKELSGFVKRSKSAANWQRRTQRRLAENGAAFHYGGWVNPQRYLSLQIVIGTCGFLILVKRSLPVALAAGAALYFLPDLLLLFLNGRDNERLLPEIKLVYHALEIQIRAGVYVTDALTECYGSVQHPRLRKALLDLAGDIVMKADIYEALEHFQGQFDNRYIDSLCMIILQALESGQALELLGDIGEQIKDMEEAVLERKKGALDRSITFYQLGILAAVLGIALYACVTHMMSAAVGF